MNMMEILWIVIFFAICSLGFKCTTEKLAEIISIITNYFFANGFPLDWKDTSGVKFDAISD